MRMYQNLEDIVAEEDSPRKAKATSSTSLKSVDLSKYNDELNYYDPFCHEKHSQTEEKGRSFDERVVFTILERDIENIEEQDETIERYPEANDLFSYNV